jgi:hypothetical protein
MDGGRADTQEQAIGRHCGRATIEEYAKCHVPLEKDPLSIRTSRKRLRRHRKRTTVDPSRRGRGARWYYLTWSG